MAATTVNANGLNREKWRKIKITMDQDIVVLAIQETHINKEQAEELEIEWRSKWLTFWGESKDRKAGVALFVKKGVFEKVSQQWPRGW